MTAKEKIISTVALLCILFGSSGFIVSLVTTKWNTITTDVHMERYVAMVKKHVDLLPEEIENHFEEIMADVVIQDFNYVDRKSLTLEMRSSIGLKHLCVNGWKLVYKGHGFDELKKKLKAKSRLPNVFCLNIDDIRKVYKQLEYNRTDVYGVRKMFDHVTSGMKTTMIYIGMSLAASLLALIISFIKLPCWYKGKKHIALAVVALCVLAGVLSVTAISVFQQEIHVTKDLDHVIENFAEVKRMTTESSLKMFHMVFEFDEQLGYSHHTAAVGIAFLLAAMILNIVEILPTKKKQSDGYEMSLVENEVVA